MEDGSVMLQAENTQFKVHRGLLARVSTIFSDVFSVPQPPKGNEVVEGCPVVHLQDTAEDVQFLMGTLYGQRCHSKEPIDPWVATALLRLGRKYEIQFLFNEVVARLKADLPCTLTQHDSPGARSWKEFQVTTSNLQYLTEFAHDCGIPELRCVLPIAYYWTTNRPGVSIIKGDEDYGPYYPAYKASA
ncbi:hypothetical protein FA13DRAFT_519284 [Coprinellus micaceus]|uniref:BTB domain-containing protein n=1 Tax=Coprinellus micaceus TaxID=71717 RepID=A0A4Y7T8N1_COPMI|nr:hypothetical protein FA13DRAFT_519284 [Coprinellus micaceus]